MRACIQACWSACICACMQACPCMASCRPLQCHPGFRASAAHAAGLYRLEPGRTVSDARVVAQGVAIGSGRKVTVELFVLASDFFNARRFANAVHSHDCLPGEPPPGWPGA